MWTVVAGLLALMFAGLNYLAWSNLIAKSGHFSRWLAVPIAPVVTVILTYIVIFLQKPNFFDPFHNLRFDTSYLMGLLLTLVILGHLSFREFGFISFMFLIDVLAVVGLIGFVLFSLSSWPTAHGGSVGRREIPNVRAAARATPMAASSAEGVTTGPTATTASASTPESQSRGPVDSRRRIYCAWCAESIPGNRALGHDCGPRHRPKIYCHFCGNAFPGGTGHCPACDATP
jgi:hypothetical protein